MIILRMLSAEKIAELITGEAERQRGNSTDCPGKEAAARKENVVWLSATDGGENHV